MDTILHPAPRGRHHPWRVRLRLARKGRMRVRRITAGVVRVLGWLPGLRAVRSYRRAWLARDLVAGIVLSTLLVPQGMAYAELAGLPPITGLYTSILCLLGYAVFGPSRILVLGPDSSLDRKSTRLNSSHVEISYAVFC